MPDRTPADLAPDLIEYFIVDVPEIGSLSIVGQALGDLVERVAIRILDVVGIVKDEHGNVTTIELDALDTMASLREHVPRSGTMLSEHDISLASLALRPATVGVVVVTEDRWAASLSNAVRRAGGHIVGGERIPAPRVEAVLLDHLDDEEGRT